MILQPMNSQSNKCILIPILVVVHNQTTQLLPNSYWPDLPTRRAMFFFLFFFANVLEEWIVIHYEYSVVSMLWIWNLLSIQGGPCSYPSSNKNNDLYVNLYNDKSHLHSILVGSTPPESCQKWGLEVTKLVKTKLLLPKLV